MADHKKKLAVLQRICTSTLCLCELQRNRDCTGDQHLIGAKPFYNKMKGEKKDQVVCLNFLQGRTCYQDDCHTLRLHPKCMAGLFDGANICFQAFSGIGCHPNICKERCSEPSTCPHPKYCFKVHPYPRKIQFANPQ